MEKFLSEAIDASKIRHGILNLITAPCGAGKTTLALSNLISLSSRPENIIYLTDTTAGARQIQVQHSSKVQVFDDDWADYVMKGVKSFNFTANKITVMCYQKFGAICKVIPNFTDNIELIICDEIHNIFWPIDVDRARAKKHFPLMNKEELNVVISASSGSYIALDKILSAAQGSSCYVVGLTATPQKVLDNIGIVEEVKADCAIFSYKTQEKLVYENLFNEICKLEKGKQYMIYVPRIKEMIRYAEFAKGRGFNTGMLWSQYNQEYPLSKEQQDLFKELVENQKFPDDIDILFFNKACETSINVFNPIDTMIIHSQEEDTITQARGRVRADLPHLYVFKPAGSDSELEFTTSSKSVPANLIGKKLEEEDKEALGWMFGSRKGNGVMNGWTKTREAMEKEGYEFYQKRVDNKRYWFIRAEEPKEETNEPIEKLSITESDVVLNDCDFSIE